MQFHDSETQRLLRTTARSYFASAYPFERLNALHKGHERLSSSDVRALWDLGWLSLLAPEDAGGGGASLLDAAVLVEEAGYACAPAPIAVASVASSLTDASEIGSSLRGGTLTTMAESGRGGSAGPPIAITNARASGTLRAVPFADISTSVIAPVLIDGTSSIAAVPLQQSAIEPLVLLDRACYANITFIDAPVDDTLILAQGQDAESLQERTTALTTALAVIEMAGLMQRVLEMTAEHIKTRQQFDQPIGKFQAARHRAAELLMQVETTRWAAYHALWQYEQNGDASEIWLAKHWAVRAADRVFQNAHMLHGGVGVGAEHPLHLYTQSIAAFAVRSGTMDKMVDRALDTLDIAV
jgi:alkylation response protein AidB-like acyl-CoA dehydrogenase